MHLFIHLMKDPIAYVFDRLSVQTHHKPLLSLWCSVFILQLPSALQHKPSLPSSCSIKPVIFSVSPRWHPDWYDGEKGSAGGGSHQSSRTRTKARVQIPPWWESDQPWDTKEHLTRHIVIWYALNIQGNPVDTPSQNLFCAFPSHRDRPSWEIRSRLCWWVAVFLANGFFYCFVSAFSSICQGLSAE